MEGTADENTLLLYKVIIHFKAAVVLYASNLQGPKSVEVQKHIRQMEYDHLTAALTALDKISFLTAPSLLLVQALITGVSRVEPTYDSYPDLRASGYIDADNRQSCELLGAHRSCLTIDCRTWLSHHCLHGAEKRDG
jgi:hypothetical protein